MELKLRIKHPIIACPLLLIVPYGIEIHNYYIEAKVHLSFNRTLWN